MGRCERSDRGREKVLLNEKRIERRKTEEGEVVGRFWSGRNRGPLSIF